MRGASADADASAGAGASAGRWRSFWPEIACACVAWACARYVAGDAMRKGFPVDDAWIHMVYGLGVVRDGALAYNDGAPATGCTSPLWAVAAALAHVAAGARAPSMAAALALKRIGAALHAATAALAARLARADGGRGPASLVAALGAGLLVATCPLLAYAASSGMEVPLAAALMLASLLGARRGSWLGAGAGLGLAFLARPESLVVAGPALALLWVRSPSGAAAARRAGAAVLATLVPVAALLARNAAVSGRPLPATFYAKAHVVRGSIVAEIRLEAARDLLRALAPAAPIFAWAIAAALLAAPASWAARRALRRAPGRDETPPVATAAAAAGTAYAVAVALLVRILDPRHFYFQRYFAPCLPLLACAAVLGAVLGCGWIAEGARRRVRVPGAAVLAVCGLLGAIACAAQLRRLPYERARYARDVGGIDAVQVAEGEYLASVLPSGAVVWAMDAGAPRYWGRHPTVDLGRLNTPQLFDRDTVRPGWEAAAIAVLAGPVRVTPIEGALEFARGFAAPDRPAGSPAFTQVVWRCRGGGRGGDDVRIDGYPVPVRGRCHVGP